VGYSFTAIPTFSFSAQPLQAAIEFQTLGFPPLVHAALGSPANIVYSSSSTPDVYGNKITMPFSATCIGCWVTGDFDAAVTMKLYDTDGATVLASVQNNTGIPPITGASANRLYFSSPVSLTGGDSYFIGAEPDTTTNFTTQNMTWPSAAAREQFQYGAYIVQSSAKNPASISDWTDLTTSLMPGFGLILSEIDIGSVPNPTLHTIEQGISE